MMAKKFFISGTVPANLKSVLVHLKIVLPHRGQAELNSQESHINQLTGKEKL